MPLGQETINQVISYCDRDVPDYDRVLGYFDFVKNQELVEALATEYVAARYIYKLGEALNVSEGKLEAHAKFQIVQYAAIYEAVIVNVLWEHYPESIQVTNIEYYSSLKKAAQLPSSINIMTDNQEEIFLCIETKSKNTQHSIKFDNKVDAAVSIGFVDRNIGEEIKEFFRVRNGVHIENAVKNDINYELELSKLAYRRVLPFTVGIRGFLQTGALPDDARPAQL